MIERGTMHGLSETAMADDAFRLTFSFGDFPELVHQLRREVARVIEEHAEATGNPEVARQLREIAAEIDAGLQLPDGWEEDLDGEG